MAKRKPIVNSIAKLQGLTYVNSAAYGLHVRAARGTYTPVEVNDTFKAISEQLVNANRPAKIVKDALDPYRQNFSKGTMWSRLVSIFRKQYQQKKDFDFRVLTDFEIHPDYPLRRLINFTLEATPDYLQSQVMIELKLEHHPHFGEDLIDGYSISLVALYPDLKRNKATVYHIERPIIKLTDKLEPLHFAIPQHSDITLLCLKVEGYHQTKMLQDFNAKAMAIVKAIEVG